MVEAGWLTWREAWQLALYGPDGFYLSERPRDHFRTSVHASPLFARAIVTLTRRLGLSGVTDLGAGAGELLQQVAAIAPELDLLGVELRPRPEALPEPIRWADELPASITGLLLANEVLDNIPCDVVELDSRELVRLVEVHPATGRERLGAPACVETTDWLQRWWPLTQAGQRAEVGLARDTYWVSACARVSSGAALAVDYGHLRDNRPLLGTVTSYAFGRQVAVVVDGRHDVTAHIAADSVAAAVDAECHLQRDFMGDLGLRSTRPPLELASTDPAAYLRALSRASQIAELTASPGLGDFSWLLSPRRPVPSTP